MLEHIIEKIDMLDLLEELGFEGRVYNNMFRSTCAMHGGNNPSSFVCNLETSLWFCHTGGCGGGDVFTLVEKMKGYSFPQAKEWLQDKYKLDLSSIDFSKREAELRKDFKEFVKYASRKRKKEINFSFDVELKDIKKLRKYNSDVLNYFGIKYSPTYNRIYFPVTFNNKLIGAQLRAIDKDDNPKWLILPKSITFGNYLFNYDNVKTEKEIVVVEGLYDVLAFHLIGVPAVATFGAHMTDEQANLLLKTFADITLSYDEDKAGALATTKAIDKLRFKARIKQVRLNKGQDPDSIDSEVLQQQFDNRITLF